MSTLAGKELEDSIALGALSPAQVARRFPKEWEAFRQELYTSGHSFLPEPPKALRKELEREAQELLDWRLFKIPAGKTYPFTVEMEACWSGNGDGLYDLQLNLVGLHPEPGASAREKRLVKMAAVALNPDNIFDDPFLDDALKVPAFKRYWEQVRAFWKKVAKLQKRYDLEISSLI